MIEFLFITSILTLGISLSYYTYRCLKNKHYKRATVCSIPSVTIMVFAILALFLVTEQTTYQRLTKEHVIATVEFTEIGNKQFESLLTQSHHDPVRHRIHGDQWQIDARIVKWKGLASYLGLQPLYKLERVSGRFKNITQEKTQERTIFRIENNELSLWNMLIEYRSYLPWIDAYYGNATYIPMKHNAKYMISLTASGLVARPRNTEASQSLKHWLASS